MAGGTRGHINSRGKSVTNGLDKTASHNGRMLGCTGTDRVRQVDMG